MKDKPLILVALVVAVLCLYILVSCGGGGGNSVVCETNDAGPILGLRTTCTQE